MLKLMFDVNRPGNRLEQVPRCVYDFITILNNSRFDFTLHRGNSTQVVDIIGNCPAYTILTFPHEKLADTVNFVWAGGGGGVETVASERCKVFFTTENMGLVGQFRAPELAPVPGVIPVRNTPWPTWSMSSDSIPNTAISLTRAALPNKQHTITSFEAVVSGAPPVTDIPISLMSGATVLWRSFIGRNATHGARTGFVHNNIEAPPNEAVILNAPAGGVGCVITLNLHGYTR